MTGSVGSYEEKQLATRMGKGVKGVKEVRNDVTSTIWPIARTRKSPRT